MDTRYLININNSGNCVGVHYQKCPLIRNNTVCIVGGYKWEIVHKTYWGIVVPRKHHLLNIYAMIIHKQFLQNNDNTFSNPEEIKVHIFDRLGKLLQ